MRSPRIDSVLPFCHHWLQPHPALVRDLRCPDHCVGVGAGAPSDSSGKLAFKMICVRKSPLNHRLSSVPRGLILLCSAEMFLEKPENPEMGASMSTISPATSLQSTVKIVGSCESCQVKSQNPLQQLLFNILLPDTSSLKNRCKGELILFYVFKPQQYLSMKFSVTPALTT